LMQMQMFPTFAIINDLLFPWHAEIFCRDAQYLPAAEDRYVVKIAMDWTDKKTKSNKRKLKNES
jgi:hypothetical protein